MDPLYWSILLILAGLCVVVVEMFVPSAGILAIVSGSLLLAGVIVAFFHSMTAGTVVLLVLLLTLPLMLAIMVKVWPHTPIGRRIMQSRMDRDEVMPTSEAFTESKTLLGAVGVAKTKMLPSGIVIINDRKYDALSEGFAIEAGQTIKVTAVKGNRILVQPYDGRVEESAVAEEGGESSDVLSRPAKELGIDIENLDLDELEE